MHEPSSTASQALLTTGDLWAGDRAAKEANDDRLRVDNLLDPFRPEKSILFLETASLGW